MKDHLLLHLLNSTLLEKEPIVLLQYAYVIHSLLTCHHHISHTLLIMLQDHGSGTIVGEYLLIIVLKQGTY